MRGLLLGPCGIALNRAYPALTLATFTFLVIEDFNAPVRSAGAWVVETLDDALLATLWPFYWSVIHWFS